MNDVTDSHMFFWFFPAETNPSTAPVVLWLQGGPGSSSMFGLFEINGPVSAVFASDGSTVIGEANPYSWTKAANVLYVDNPVGAGFSHTGQEGFVTTQEEVGVDLYEMLQQWFTMFPEYQANDFFVFGESYAGEILSGQ